MKLGITFLILLPSLLLVSCGKDKSGLTGINDPAALRKDCALLYQQFPYKEDPSWQADLGRIVPTNSWPVSVRALNPFRVKRDEFGVSIWILFDVREEPGKKWQAIGYYVRENPDSSPPRIASGMGGEFDLKYTKYDRIDIFYSPWIIN
jgi:hypothetical protein